MTHISKWFWVPIFLRMLLFVHSSILFCLFTALHNLRSMSSNFHDFYNSGSISSRLAAFLFLVLVSITLSSPLINCQKLMSTWLRIIFWYVYQILQEGFRADFWNFLSAYVVFLFSWQFLVLHSTCFSFSSLQLLSAVLIVIVYLLSNFRFYWFGLVCILVVPLVMC